MYLENSTPELGDKSGLVTWPMAVGALVAGYCSGWCSTFSQKVPGSIPDVLTVPVGLTSSCC